MRKLVDRTFLVGQSFKLFSSAIRSPATRDPYERRLAYFLGSVGKNSDEFVTEAKADTNLAEKAVLDFISSEKERVEKKEIAPGTITNGLKAVRLLLEMNDVSLNWKKIRRTLPRSRRYALDRIPTMEEMRAIVDNCDVRGRALTLTFVSSGIREGAIETLKVGDLSPVVQNGKIIAGKLIVYPGDEEQYVAFITIEAYNSIQQYIEYRQRSGEDVRSTSPLFRDKFDPIENIHARKIHNTHVQDPKPLNGPAIRRYYGDLFYSLGFRNGPKRRHEFSVHGFRKWFKTNAERSGMKPIDVETLMGHSTGISDSYYRPTETDLLTSYLAIADHLLIGEVVQLEREMAEKDVKHQIDMASVMDVLQGLKAEVGILKAQGRVGQTSAELANLQSQHDK